MYFFLKTMHNSVLYDSTKSPCQGKLRFFSHGLKCSQQIRLQYSLIINFSGRNQSIFQIFYTGIIINGRQHLRLPLLGVCGQLCFWANQKPGFFDQQYLWNTLNDAFVSPLSVFIYFVAFFIKYSGGSFSYLVLTCFLTFIWLFQSQKAKGY